MRAKVKKSIIFKDGYLFPEGTDVIVSVEQDRPSVAILEEIATGIKKRVHSLNLHRYFNEFISCSMDEIEEAVTDGDCQSLTGESVEPDGWDSEGFPSILLAMSII